MYKVYRSVSKGWNTLSKRELIAECELLSEAMDYPTDYISERFKGMRIEESCFAGRQQLAFFDYNDRFVGAIYYDLKFNVNKITGERFLLVTISDRVDAVLYYIQEVNNE